MKRCRVRVERVYGSDAVRAYCTCGWKGPRRGAGPLRAREKKANGDAIVHLGPTLLDVEARA